MASVTIRRFQLGAELATARRAKDLSQDDVSKRLGMSARTVARFEAGDVGISEAKLAVLMDLFEITDSGERSRLEQLRKESKERSWWSAHKSGLRSSYQTLIGLEDAASGRMDYAAVVVPGLLQTEAYAKAVFAASLPRLSDDTIDLRVKVRLQRQGLVSRARDPLTVHVVLDEACLRRRVGGEEVWREQLAHLITLTEQPNVTLQVLPLALGAYPESLGAFTILQLRAEQLDDLVYVELSGSDLFIEGSDAERYRLLFDALRAQAAPPQQSVAEISRIMDAGE